MLTLWWFVSYDGWFPSHVAEGPGNHFGISRQRIILPCSHPAHPRRSDIIILYPATRQAGPKAAITVKMQTMTHLL